MFAAIFGRSRNPKVKTFTSRGIERASLPESVTDRQRKIPGFEQKALRGACGFFVGAGGLSGVTCHSLVRKGIGEVKDCDEDIVMPSNLNRQLYFKKDLYKNKAFCLAKNLIRECTGRTVIRAYPFTFQRVVEEGIDTSCSFCYCGVDNNPTRDYVARHFYKLGIPVVFSALTEDANHGYVFVQEPGKACFGCAFPEAVNDETYPCPGAGAVIDLLKITAGLASFAIDTLIMPQRKRNWNLRKVFMSGFVADSGSIVERREDCPICGAGRLQA